MSMRLISETLLQNEIQRLEEKQSPELLGNEHFYYTVCKKELLTLSRLRIEAIDLTGEIEEVSERLNKQAILFMDLKEYEAMKEKAAKYDMISKLVNEKGNQE